MILNVNNVSKGFNKEILKNINFNISEKERVGLIGINGAGKSTLLKILTGELTEDSGEIIVKQGVEVGYLRQSSTELEITIFEELMLVFENLIKLEEEIEKVSLELEKNSIDQNIQKLHRLNEMYEMGGGFLYKSKVNGVIKGLGLNKDQKIGNLSGGQRRVVSMAKLLLSNNDLLLLDEPTNHLDLETINWLEDYLRSYDGALLIVSHDRYFINKLVTKIVEIEHGNSEIYSGNYDYYLKEKESRKQVKKHHFEVNQQQIKKMEDSIALLKSFGREKQVKRARSKEKALNKMERLEDVIEVKNAVINFKINKTTGNDVLTVRNLVTFIGDNIISKNINFDIKRGDRVALIGPVGVGKTTLFNNILERENFTEDEVIFGTNLEIGVYDQHHDKKLNMKSNVFEEIHNVYPHLTNLEVRNALAAFLFSADDVFKEISSLSGGEKARVLLTILSLSGANTLFLDEPTNHLDINTKTILEEALLNYEGTIFYISHDRYFINETATKILTLSSSGVKEYLGNYDYYTEKLLEQEEDNVKEEVVSKQNSKEEYEQKKKKESEERSNRNKLKNTEKKIEQVEIEIKDLEKELEQEQNHVKLAEIFKSKEDKEKFLEELYNLWEELTSLSTN